MYSNFVCNMKKFLSIILILALFVGINQKSQSQVLSSEVKLSTLGSGATPSLISAADTVILYGTFSGTGKLNLSTTLEATGTSPTITGAITLWVSLDGVFYFLHPDGGSTATTTLSTQAPTTSPTTTFNTTTSNYTKSWAIDNNFKFYLIRVIASSLGGTSPTFNVTGKGLLRKTTGNL